MSRQHSIIGHPKNYFFVPLEDDYLFVYELLAQGLDPIKEQQGKPKSASCDCKAMITAILEGWMNSKRAGATNEGDLYVYFTIDQWVQQTRGRFKRNTIIQCLSEMGEEGSYTDPQTQEVYTGTIIKRPYIQNTFGYVLNLPVIQSLLDALPEQSPYGLKSRPVLGRPSKSSLKKDGINESSLNLNGLKKDRLSEKQFKKGPINAKSSLKKDGSFYTQNSNTQIEDYTDKDTYSADLLSQDRHASLTAEEMIALLSQQGYTILPSNPTTQENSANDNDSQSQQTVRSSVEVSPDQDRIGDTPQQSHETGNQDSAFLPSQPSENTSTPLNPANDTRVPEIAPQREIEALVPGTSKQAASYSQSGQGEQNTPLAAETDQPKKRATRKPRAKKFVVPDDLRERVNKVYAKLDELRQKVTSDPEERYIRDEISDKAICDLFQGKPPTEKRLEQIFMDMWNEPKNTRSGWWTREHMTIVTICKKYLEKSMVFTAQENQAKGIVGTFSAGGYTYRPEDEPVEELVYVGPSRKNRRRA